MCGQGEGVGGLIEKKEHLRLLEPACFAGASGTAAAAPCSMLGVGGLRGEGW